MVAKSLPDLRTADVRSDVVVFLIGMRINHFRAPHHWLPALLAMPRMLRELGRDPSSGLLGHELLSGSPRLYYVVQYWESKEKLLDFAAATEKSHRPMWAKFNRLVRRGKGHVGLWHETYLVPAGSHESIYADMPPYGLGRAFGTVPLREGVGARERLAA